MSNKNVNASERAADKIVAEIEDQITNGMLPGGARLPSEREMMEVYGASRTVVREAVTALSNRGLVDSKPRFRPVVRQASYEHVLETTGVVVQRLLRERAGVANLYEARVFIECGLARQAAASATRDDILNLKKALADNKNAIENTTEFFATDVAFHRVLHEVSGNPVFSAVHEAFTSWLYPQWEKMIHTPQQNAIIFDQHQSIYDAILERDPDAAEGAVKEHLDASWDYVSVTFNQDTPE